MYALAIPVRGAGRALAVVALVMLPATGAAQQAAEHSGESLFAIAPAGWTWRKGPDGAARPLVGIAAGVQTARRLDPVLRAAGMAEIAGATEEPDGIHSYRWFLDVGADYTLFIGRDRRPRIFAGLGAGGMLKRTARGHDHREFSKAAWAVGGGLEVPAHGAVGMQLEGRLLRSFDGAEEYVVLSAGVRSSKR